MAKETAPPGKTSSRRRGLARFGKVCAGFALLYAAFLLLGFVPVNRESAPPGDGDSVRIFIRNNEIHTDLVLPVVCNDLPASETIDWRELFPPADFRADVSEVQHVAIGWGNRRFFVDTERWADVRPGTLLSAIVPSETVLHVEYVPGAAPSRWLREVRVTREQYEELVAFVRSSVAELDAEQHAVLATDKSYHGYDRFYAATGSYHLFNNCNQWTGRGLGEAGLPTGIWTPLKSQVYCWLPEAESPAR